MAVARPLTVVALHGFLGRSSDWKNVQAFLPAAQWIVPDYTFESRLAPDVVTLAEWGDTFCRWLSRQVQEPVLLVGYSQGGRLAMHAFEKRAEMFSRVILISTQPGIPASEVSARLLHDEAWAKKFESEPWGEVVKAWNSQRVFCGGGQEPHRLESSDARKIASASLRNWSVAKQVDFQDFLKSQKEKVMLVAGEKDQKYVEITKALSGQGLLSSHIVEKSGHRVLFDAPEALSHIISNEVLYLRSAPNR